MTEKCNFKKARKLFLFISFFYLTIYTPFGFAVYLPNWHQLNCRWNIRCHSLGEETSTTGIRELNSFFLHRSELDYYQWTDKEKHHLREVRQLTDTIFVGAVFAAILTILFFDRKQITTYTWINTAVILSCLAVLPFFAYFWRYVFHPLLFENKLWLNTSNDFSFYLMPRAYFKATTVFIIGTSCTINIAIWLLLQFGVGKKETPA